MFDTTNGSVVLLDGRPPGDNTLTPALTALSDVLHQGHAEVQAFSLADAKLAHCIGCFACWLETPGLCRYHEPDGVTILQAVLQSDTVVLFTPVAFGGYGAPLKQIVDRFPSLLLPYFDVYHGEVHHRPRYPRFPRLVAVGVQEQPDPETARLFSLLAGRNAINFHSSSYAAEVVSTGDARDDLRAIFRSLLARDDPLPWGSAIKPLLPQAEPLAEGGGAGRACLLVGSPKTLTPSTSRVLGGYLLERLQERGWQTESLTLTPSHLKARGQADLLAAVDRADLLLIAFPLYVDALPFLLTRALEVIAAHRRTTDRHPQRVVAIANNGFPEAYQNHLALAICRRFAAQSGLTWAGGLALGAGEGTVGGQPLQAKMPSGLPATHIIKALDATGAALAQGQAVPIEAVRQMASPPIPLVPLALWQRMFPHMTNAFWDQQAAKHGLPKEAMPAQPYAAAPAR